MFAECVCELSAEPLVVLGEAAVALVGGGEPLSQGGVGGALPCRDRR